MFGVVKYPKEKQYSKDNQQKNKEIYQIKSNEIIKNKQIQKKK